jgi:ribosomal protein S12 methylthiotransferase
VGRTLDVLIEGQGDGLTLGRSYRDAPEIDGMVILQAAPLGEFVPVKIDGAMTYDLTGQVELKQGQVITLGDERYVKFSIGPI